MKTEHKEVHAASNFKAITMKKVLIALDYNSTAKKIAEEGYSLAKNMNAEAILLHVIADDTYYTELEYSPIMGFGGFSGFDFHEFAKKDGLQKASEYFLEEIKNHLGDDKIEIKVEQGDFAEAILSASRYYNADIIVMGSHSRRWLEKVLLGSVTQEVLNQTLIPLFIIPTKNQN